MEMMNTLLEKDKILNIFLCDAYIIDIETMKSSF